MVENSIRNGQYKYCDWIPYKDDPLFSRASNNEPFIRQFLVSKHITFCRTPDLLLNLASYYTLSNGWALATFVPIILMYLVCEGQFSAAFTELHTIAI